MEETFQGQTYKVKKKMPLKRKILLAVLILFVILLLLFIAREIYDIGERRSIAGIGDPIQTPAEGDLYISSFGFDVHLTFEQKYEIEGLAVHTRRYFGFFSMADAISPMDVGLAWGKVAENNKSIDFGWDHNDRQLVIEPSQKDGYKIALIGGVDYVTSHCSNNHLIPADFGVSHDIKKIRRGDHVRLKGYLVSVSGSRFGQEYAWDSSLSRTDTGNGACEVMYVTEVEFLD
ncbi:MAG: hypothetical protein IKP47_00920 [Ruminococcus sp.]|nr:hypothetical protein [Ruminococcus sp.]